MVGRHMNDVFCGCGIPFRFDNRFFWLIVWTLMHAPFKLTGCTHQEAGNNKAANQGGIPGRLGSEHQFRASNAFLRSRHRGVSCSVAGPRNSQITPDASFYYMYFGLKVKLIGWLRSRRRSPWLMRMEPQWNPAMIFVFDYPSKPLDLLWIHNGKGRQPTECKSAIPPDLATTNSLIISNGSNRCLPGLWHFAAAKLKMIVTVEILSQSEWHPSF